MISIAAGFLLGITISIPVGPVNIALFNLTLSRGISKGVWLALGAALMDGLYLGVFLTGMHRLDLPAGLVSACYSFGLFLLLGLGLKDMLWPAVKAKALPAATRRPESGVHYTGLGILFYVTNPGFPVFFASLALWLGSNPHLSEMLEFPGSLLAATGTCLGSMVWFLVYMRGIEMARRHLTDRILVLINRMAGAMLTGCAVWLMVKHFT